MRRVDPPAYSDAGAIRTGGGVEVPLGAGWSGIREYEVEFELRDGPDGEDLQAAVVDLVHGEPDRPRPTGPVRAVKVHWTRFPGGSRISRSQRDLADAIWAGCTAYESGDLADAGRYWAQACRRARRTGDNDSLRRLSLLVAADQISPDDVIAAGRVGTPVLRPSGAPSDAADRDRAC